MKLTMTPKSRSTGNSHKIVDESITTRKVKLDEEGVITISLEKGPIDTSGNFNGKLTLSLSEIHNLLGLREEKKLELLRKLTSSTNK